MTENSGLHFYRFPDQDDHIRWVELAMNPWSDELYRRMIKSEDCVPEYTLPPLDVISRENWEKSRRGELLKLFEDTIYGKIPPPPDRLEGVLLSERDDALNGLAIRKEIQVVCTMNDGRKWDFNMLLYIPIQADNQSPVFCGLNFEGNPSCTNELDIFPARGVSDYPHRWYRTAPPDSFLAGKRVEHWNFEEAIKRGYAVATVDHGEIFPDNPCGFEKSIYTLFHAAEELQPYRSIGNPLDCSGFRRFGAIGAWAWGLSRMLDILEREPLVNTKQAAVIGHSRLGKAAIWAGANDQRFNLVISNNSGCLGAAISRRCFGETLMHIGLWRTYWFNEELIHYWDRENELPVDQHQLLAMIAPRTLYVASSSEDIIADPYGEFLSAKYASEVWRFYGQDGLIMASMPSSGSVILGNGVCYHLKKGHHSITPWDWRNYYNCADHVLKNMVFHEFNLNVNEGVQK